MIRVHQVVLRGVPVHQVDAPAAARAHVAGHAPLVHYLQRLGEVGAVDEVQAAELLVGGRAGGAHGGQQLGPHGLHGARLHRGKVPSSRARLPVHHERRRPLTERGQQAQQAPASPALVGLGLRCWLLGLQESDRQRVSKHPFRVAFIVQPLAWTSSAPPCASRGALWVEGRLPQASQERTGGVKTSNLSEKAAVVE